MMRFLFTVLLLMGGGTAQAALVDFEGVAATSPCGSYPNPCPSSIITPQGFVFAVSPDDNGNEVFVGDYNYASSSSESDGNFLTVFGPPADPRSITITHQSGQAFSLTAMDIFIYDTFGGEGYSTVTAYDSSDNILGTQNVIRQQEGWETVLFDASWGQVHSVVVGASSSCGFGGCIFNFPMLDNVSASVVPIPAAAWLFGSALLGLGWLRRA